MRDVDDRIMCDRVDHWHARALAAEAHVAELRRLNRESTELALAEIGRLRGALEAMLEPTGLPTFKALQAIRERARTALASTVTIDPQPTDTADGKERGMGENATDVVLRRFGFAAVDTQWVGKVVVDAADLARRLVELERERDEARTEAHSLRADATFEYDACEVARQEATTLRANLANARAEVKRMRGVVGAARVVIDRCEVEGGFRHMEALRTALAALDAAGEGES